MGHIIHKESPLLLRVFFMSDSYSFFLNLVVNFYGAPTQNRTGFPGLQGQCITIYALGAYFLELETGFEPA
jgi:hypothetical protein